MGTLKEKLEQVKDEHLERVIEGQIEKHDLAKNQAAYMLIGGIRSVHRVSDNLNSQVMAAMIQFQKEDMHECFGYKRFADFLDESEFSPMKKSEFYRRKELFDSEGGQIYDAFNAARIPVATRKLLLSGTTQIEIDGDQLIIGDQRADVKNAGAVKDIILAITEDLRNERTEREKSDAKAERLDAQVKTGKDEYDELRRNLDALNEQSPVERAFSRALSSMLKLTTEASELSPAEKKKRAKNDLQIFAAQWYRLRDAYGSTLAFSEDSGPVGDEFLDRAMKQIALDDLGDD
jgi:hypothetical protein